MDTDVAVRKKKRTHRGHRRRRKPTAPAPVHTHDGSGTSPSLSTRDRVLSTQDRILEMEKQVMKLVAMSQPSSEVPSRCQAAKTSTRHRCPSDPRPILSTTAQATRPSRHKDNWSHISSSQHDNKSTKVRKPAHSMRKHQQQPSILHNWKQNCDGTITGYLLGPAGFEDGEGTLTTTDAVNGRAIGGTIVTTASGSRYSLSIQCF